MTTSRTARTLLVATLALALAIILLGAGTAQATFPGENGKIAFQVQRDDVIRTVNPDGSAETFLTCRDEVIGAGRVQRLPAADPVWSPDGRRIAFTRYSIADWQFDGPTENWIFVLNPDGSQSLVAHFEADDIESPAWSPDGERLAFKAGGYDLVVAHRDGTELTRVFANGFYSPSWSPDGERVAFARMRSLPQLPDEPRGLPPIDIWVMNADGTGQVNLTEEDREYNSQPAWSPAGERILFTQHNPETALNDIWVMNADGTGQTQLTDDRAHKERPTWSPDGERTHFFRDTMEGFGGDIWMMNADGSDQRLLGVWPLWSPDSQKLAFRRDGAIWTMDLDGSDARRLVPGAPIDWQRVPPGAEGVPIPTQFCFTELQRNTNRGIARLTVEVSGPGRVILHERPGVRRFAQAHREAGPGRVVLRVRPRGKARQRLNRQVRRTGRGRVRVRVQVTYRPWEGAPRTRTGRAWLVRTAR